MPDQDKADPPAPQKAPTIGPHVRRRRRRPSSVWIIPVIALLLGGGLLFQHYTSQGPRIEITFETAEGIVAEKTEVRCRSVRVGTVESVRLGDDLDHIVTVIRMDASSTELLKRDSLFWVVRPRLASGSISGLNTLLSGAYIELDPGLSSEKQREFVGLEHPPATAQGVPGVHFTLVSEEAGSLSVGAPILYKGMAVGRIESRELQPLTNKIEFGGFVRAPHDHLLLQDTKFWNVSGIDLQVDANGIQLRTGTIESLFSGGVAFANAAGVNNRIFPVKASPQQAADGTVYRLYDNFRATKELNLDNCPDYLLLFEDSIRGLRKDAPVEFRGIQVGTVTEVSLNYRLLGEDPGPSVPVFVKIDPLRLRLTDFPPNVSNPEELLGIRESMVADAVAGGLRASLRTGNFLTGQLFVDLEFDEDDAPKAVGRISKFNVIPTSSSGLARLQESLLAVLEKIEHLPVEPALIGATETLAEFKTTAAALRGAVASIEQTAATFSGFVAADDTQNIPEDLAVTLASLRETLAGFDEQSIAYRELTDTMNELRETLRSVTTLSDSINREPNSLIFGKPSRDVEPPRAKRP